MLALLQSSADQSAIMNQLEPNDQSDMKGDMEDDAAEDNSVVYHNGKKYMRV
mgnify:CR=1 FL=1